MEVRFMELLIDLSEVFKIIVLVSILYVWVVRYDNIKQEFQLYQIPEWLRDLVGILKISFAVMLFNENTLIILLGSSGIIFLMAAALVTHIRMKNPVYKMLPSLSLLTFSSFLFYINF